MKAGKHQSLKQRFGSLCSKLPADRAQSYGAVVRALAFH